MDASDNITKPKERYIIVSFFSYYPKRCKAASAGDKIIRDFIWGFKRGLYTELIAKHTAMHMIQHFGCDTKNLIFVCIPASSVRNNERRWREFSKMVCQLTGADNGYEHMSIFEDRIPLHRCGHNSKIDTANVIDYDVNFFSGRKVLCFDDVRTRGVSFEKFAGKLESMGAVVVGGFFLAETTKNNR